MPMTLNELIRDRGRFFWILNIAGWSGYVLTAYLGALAHEKPDSYIAVIMATAVAGFLLTIPMRLFYQRLWERSPVAIGAGVLVKQPPVRRINLQVRTAGITAPKDLDT